MTGGSELLIVLIVIVVVFGGAWLPKAARNLGRAKVELDKTQKQIEDTKQQVVQATGIRELESTVRKANRTLNTSPQNLLKGAAASAMKPPAKDAGPADGAQPTMGDTERPDDEIVDAEIVATEKVDGEIVDPADESDGDNINLDFS